MQAGKVDPAIFHLSQNDRLASSLDLERLRIPESFLTQE